MCGIHLIWGKGADKASIQLLVDASRHRGPDQQAVYSPWQDLWIGVNRLSILHPGPEANQPFWIQDGNSLLIWNGEIYNHLEIRKLLNARGVACETRSDTEVLAYSLKLFGTEAFKKIEGMFALIYIDLIEKSVLVARDSNGEKPLYFFQNQDTLILSSETRGIADLLQTDVDFGQVENYFYLRTPAPGKTFYKGIQSWKPGTNSLIQDYQTIQWDTWSTGKSGKKFITKEIFQSTLEQVVINQLQADVPVGVLLSGGMDSSLMYALWYQQTASPLPTFTIQVERQYRNRYSDGEAASRFTKAFPSYHQLLEVSQETFLNHWDEFLQTVDQPIGDSAGFLTWFIGKHAKRQVKVLASGAGADELWGGYQRHSAFHYYLQNRSLWLAVSPILQYLPLGRAWKKFSSGIRRNAQETFINFSAISNPNTKLYAEYLRIMDPNYQTYKQALDFDRQVYLVEDVLKIQDNSLMAQGIEGRSPYLDSQMIKLWKAVEDPALLLGKPWIASCLVDLNLEWISVRKKTGFGLPLREWLGEGGPVAKKVFAALNEFGGKHQSLLSQPLKQVTQHPEKHVQRHFLLIYNLFLLAEWLKLQER
jgi:asparagine synthase (glutamine-hydrolysing)